MRHIAKGIGQLAVAQGPPRPIGEARAFVDLDPDDGLNQAVIADGVAETADHARDLGVEDRRWHGAAEMDENLNILSRGVEDFQDLWRRHQGEHRRQIDAVRQRVDQHRVVRAGDLQQAEFRIVGVLAHKLGIDRDIARGHGLGAELFQRRGGRDNLHA